MAMTSLTAALVRAALKVAVTMVMTGFTVAMVTMLSSVALDWMYSQVALVRISSSSTGETTTPLIRFTDFTVGEDQIEFQGIGDRKIAYDAITGIVSVDGQAFIQLDPGLDFSEDDYFLQ